MTPPYPLITAVRWSLDPEHVQRILRTRVETAAGGTPVVQYLVHRVQDAPHHAYWAYAQELTLLEETALYGQEHARTTDLCEMPHPV